MSWCRVRIFFIIGFSDAGLDGSTVTPVFVVEPIFLHMKFSEFSVKLSRLFPSVVSLYIFLGLSVAMFHSLFT